MSTILEYQDEKLQDYGFGFTIVVTLDSNNGVFRRYHVGNSPVNFVDPLGLYDIDVHLGWTYIWATEADFSANDALTIATANQGADEGLSNPFLWPLGATALHFMSRKEGPLQLSKHYSREI